MPTYRVSKASSKVLGEVTGLCFGKFSANTQGDGQVVWVDRREEGRDVAGNAEELLGLNGVANFFNGVALKRSSSRCSCLALERFRCSFPKK
jgi:hypothetical protein